MKKTVGQFSIENGTLAGPASYMNEKGNMLVDSICAGNDTIFNMTSGYSPDIETAILVRIQTDYAGWLGQKQMESWMNRGGK